MLADGGGVDEGVEGAGEAALIVHEVGAPGAFEAVPHRLALGVDVVTAQVRKTAHRHEDSAASAGTSRPDRKG
jgi:hypothetical protein